jgi:hypothetical protein
MKFYILVFFKTLSWKFKFIKIWQEKDTLHEDLCTLLWYFTQFYLEREMLQTNVIVKIKTILMSSISFIHSFILWARQLIPRMHLSLGLIVQPLNIHSAEIQQPSAFYGEAKVSYWGCAYIFCFNKQIPKNVVALTSQRLTAANTMLHTSSLLSAESAGWIPIKQANSIQVPSYRSMSSEDGKWQSQEMPT